MPPVRALGKSALALLAVRICPILPAATGSNRPLQTFTTIKLKGPLGRSR